MIIRLIHSHSDTRFRYLPKTRSPRSRSGFSLLEIVCVVGFIAMVAALAVPSLIKSRKRAQTAACIENLKQIYAAQQQWVFEAKPDSKDLISKRNLLPYFKGGKFPDCPSGGTYRLGNTASKPDCSLSTQEGHSL